MLVKLTVSVVFENVAGKPWDGFEMSKVVDFPIEPSKGIEWVDAIWPDDTLTITNVAIWQGQDPPVECDLGELDSPYHTDYCEYETYNDAREAYKEAGWEISWEAPEGERNRP